MKSARGAVAATFFLAALPVAAIWQLAFRRGAEATIHIMFALGSGVLCSAVSQFKAPGWAVSLGLLSSGLLALIFMVQGISGLIESAPLARVAFQVLGQQLEGWLLNGLIVWCFAVVLADRQGRTKLIGLVALSLAALVRGYVVALSLGGASPDAAPALKLFYLLPFVWLLLESLTEAKPRTHPASPHTRSRATPPSG